MCTTKTEMGYGLMTDLGLLQLLQYLHQSFSEYVQRVQKDFE